jgi:hypothetical protein
MMDDMLVTSTSMKRDRDNTVTGSFPVLVSAYARRDGLILPPEGMQIEAQILPLGAAEGIFDSKKRREYAQVYDKVSPDELAELQALALLSSAVSQRKLERMKTYTERMAPLEAKRAVERLVNDMKQWGGSVSGKQQEIERARALHALRERVKFPWHELNWQLNEWLGKARVVLWLALGGKRKITERLSPGLYCENMAAALGALLFSRVASPQAVSICGRCGSPFIRTKRIQRFCSLRCGNADRKARERAKFRRRAER